MVATAISLKIPMSIIVNIFESNVTTIFPSTKSSFWSYVDYAYGIVNQFRGDKYSTLPLRKVLEEMYKDKSMKDLHTLLCIPSFNVSKSQASVFTNKKEEFQDTENDTLEKNPYINVNLVDIVLASAAAPTYFSPYKINDDYYVDGGIWANNPSFVGIMESMKYYIGKNKKYDTYSLLSISNLTEKLNYDITNPTTFFNITNFPELLSIMITANISSAEYFINKLDDCHVGKLQIEHKESENFSLDDSNLKFLNELKEWAKKDVSKKSDISNYCSIAKIF